MPMPPSFAAPEGLLPYVEPGTHLILPLGAAEPSELLGCLDDHGAMLTDVQVHRMHAVTPRRYLTGAHRGLREVSYFLSRETRPGYEAGVVDFVPSSFHRVGEAILGRTDRQRRMVLAPAVDLGDGRYSLATTADYVLDIIRRRQARVILEVNPGLPRVESNAVDAALVDAVHHVAARQPIEVPPAPIGPVERRIAELVAERIGDGATLQIGIGAIPDAVLHLLRDRRGLRIWTELLTDGIVGLDEAGALDPAAPVTATISLGTRRLYRWLEERQVRMLGVEHVNDPVRIAAQPSMVSVNASLEVDLYGQAASETRGGMPFSGSGGQADFALGAAWAGGKGFVVLPSTWTDRDGRLHSRIVPSLSPRSVVTTHKNDVHHVVTEHGVADLRHRTYAERARALIDIAHPAFRDELLCATRGALRVA